MEIKLRENVQSDRKWVLEDIISDEKDIPILMDKARAILSGLKTYEGKLSPTNILDFLKKQDELSLILEKIYVYANMRSDEDKGESKYLELSEKASMLMVEAGSALSFFRPELAAFEDAVLQEMKGDVFLSDYSMLFDGILRNKKHILSDKEEAIMSQMSLFAGDFKETFQVFNNADLDFGEIEVDGKPQAVTHSSYSVFLQHPSQDVRKRAFEAVYACYKQFTNTIAANYAGNVKKNTFYAKVRGFDSSLSKALFSENIDASVYENLLNTIEKNTSTMHEYVSLRKILLGVHENHMYDMYVPIVAEATKTYEYDAAYSMVIDAMDALGDDYKELLARAKVGGWIDVEATKGKRSGAYSWGAYGVHPYVLLNHNGTLHDVFTIAHEMGHAMHSYYSDKAQPYSKAQYEIFVAEIASTVNEVLLLKHLLKTASDDMKKYLLSYFIDMFRTTVFRQTMFAEFEKFSHESVESGQPLSSDRLSEYYFSLNKKYYGDGVIHDDYIRYEWSRIPHFYSAFYVYKYATGLICAVNIAKRLLSGEKGFCEKYKSFLSSGGSMYPLEILKLVDIDLTKTDAFDSAMAEFRLTVQQLKAEFEI